MTPQATDLAPLIATLERDEPSFNGAVDEPRNWRIGFEVLRWIAETADDQSVTLETGCGYSTVIFAATGAHHTVISPMAVEHERVREWCAERSIDTNRVTFRATTSELELPSADGPLDLVLIDGSHAFPVPYMDWFYTAGRLNVGGHVIVDDVHLKSGWVLRDFLRAQSQDWAHVRDFRRSAAFRKLREVEPGADGWRDQPWQSSRLGILMRRLRLEATHRLLRRR